MISSNTELRSLASRIKDSPWIAIDTEADSLHSYPEQLCLVQVSLPDADVLVDPLSGVNLDILFQAFEARELILHGADFDLRLLHRLHGFVPSKVFDTMIAARLLGEPRFGLAALVEQHLGVVLEKTSRKANWAVRPLPAKLREYAKNDTRHLHPLAAWLGERLEALERRSWLEESCERLVAECTSAPEIDPDTQWRIRGSERLEPYALAHLRELWRWREEEALAARRPPYFVLSHEAMVSLAEQAATAPRVPPLPRRLSRRRREGLVEALRRGHATPERDWPKRRPRHRRSSGRLKGAAATLAEVRDRVAKELGLDPSVLASRGAIEKIAADPAAAETELMRWQRELLAEALPPVAAVTR